MLNIVFFVQNVDYDKEGSVLRIRGKNILESEHVKVPSSLNMLSFLN